MRIIEEKAKVLESVFVCELALGTRLPGAILSAKLSWELICLAA